jgi:hypothetical protein
MAKFTMQKREKVVLAVGAVVVVIIIGQWLVSDRGPLKTYKQSVTQIQAARRRLVEARSIRDVSLARRQSSEALEQKLRARGAFGLYTHVDRALQAQNLKSGEGARATLETQNTAVRSGAFEAVKLRLDGVSMEELLGLLVRIYSGDNLVVLDRLDELRPADDGRGLTCTMVLMAPRG